jgi:hypothetical protein
LLKENVDFKWTEQQQQQAFSQLKMALSSVKVMTYFDPIKQTEVLVDASPGGVSGVA